MSLRPGLAILILLLPLTGAPEPQRIARVAAYALVLACVVSLLHGFLIATRSYATPRVLALGAAAAGSGFLFAALARPENLEEGLGFLASFALFLADLCRILAAASVGVSLARHVSSAGVILLIAAVATASDLFSVFAGPTRTLVAEDSPVLDLLLLVFPTFGSAPGFGLGASDFVFLTLFAAASRFLNLRYTAVRLLRHARHHDRGFAARTSATRPPVRCRRIRARKRGPHPRFSHEEAPIQHVNRCAGASDVPAPTSYPSL